MKMKQHKEKLEIIRNIIRETLLGNAAIVVLVSMIFVMLEKPWSVMSVLCIFVYCISLMIVSLWWFFIVFIYISELTESVNIMRVLVAIWVLSSESFIIYNIIGIFHKVFMY
ncbi:hypothetical protein E9K80_005250 [Escherichia coli]|nr:hypothetical protein [Escherichia coli]